MFTAAAQAVGNCFFLPLRANSTILVAVALLLLQLFVGVESVGHCGSQQWFDFGPLSSGATCAEIANCIAAYYCPCLGRARGMTPSERLANGWAQNLSKVDPLGTLSHSACSNSSAAQAPSSSALCLRWYGACLYRAVGHTSGCNGTSGTLGLYNSLRSLEDEDETVASGYRYDNSTLKEECNEFMSCHTAGTATGGSTSSGSTPNTTETLCLAPSLTTLTLNISASSWTDVLYALESGLSLTAAHERRKALVAASLKKDLENKLKTFVSVTTDRITVTVQSVRARKRKQAAAAEILTAKADIFQSFDTEQQTFVATAGGSSSGWLTETESLYKNYTGLDVTLSAAMEVTSLAETAAPTTPSPTTPSESSAEGLLAQTQACGSGCVAGIVLGSCCFLLLCAVFVYAAVRIYKDREIDELASEAQREVFEEKCKGLGLDVQRATALIAKAREDMETDLDRNGTVSFVSLIFRLAREVVRESPFRRGCKPSQPAHSEEPPVTFAELFMKRFGERVNEASSSKCPFDTKGTSTGTGNRPTKATRVLSQGSGSDDQVEVETLSSVEYLVVSEEELMTAAATFSPNFAGPQSYSDEEFLTLIYAMGQYDTPERKERTCYLHFTTGEATLFGDYLRREEELGRFQDLVPYSSFFQAYRWAKGKPNDALKTRLFDYPDATIHKDKLLKNISTAPDCSIERSYVADYTQHRARTERMAVECLYFVPFLVMFLVFGLLGYGYEEGFYSQWALSERTVNYLFPFTEVDFPANCGNGPDCAFWSYLFKLYPSVVNEEDFWEWIEGPLLRGLWWRNGAYSATEPIDLVNMPVGALKIRQVRVLGEDSTAVSKAFFSNPHVTQTEQSLIDQQWFDRSPGSVPLGKRYPTWSEGLMDESAYGLGRGNVSDAYPTAVLDAYRFMDGAQLNGTESIRGRMDTWYPSGGYALLIPFNATQTEALSYVDDLKNNAWIDRQTRALIAELHLYNRDIQTLSRMRWVVEVSTGGSYRPLMENTVYSIYRRGEFSGAYYFFFALYFGILFLFVVPNGLIEFFWSTPRRQLRARGQAGIGRHFSLILTVSTVDLLVVLKAMCSVMFIVEWIYRLWWMHETLDRVPTVLYQVDHFPNYLDGIAHRARLLMYLKATNVMLLFGLLLVYASEIPALAIISKTLRRASYSLSGIALIFLLAILTFALTGHVVYGNNLVEYCNMGFALGTTALSALGEYDYASLKMASKAFTPVFYTLTMLFLVLLLMSMIVSVLMDAFGEVVAEQFQAGPVKRLIHNDPIASMAVPTFTDQLRALPLSNHLKTIVRLAYCRIKQGVAFVENKCNRTEEKRWVSSCFSYREASKEVWRGNHPYFWQRLSNCVKYVQRGSAVDAFFGSAYVGFLDMPAAVKGYDVIERQHPGAPVPLVHMVEAHSLRRKLEDDFFGEKTDQMLTVFQEWPSLHLGLPSAVSLLHMLEHYSDWSKRVSAYQVNPQETSVVDRARDVMDQLQTINEGLKKRLHDAERRSGKAKRKMVRLRRAAAVVSSASPPQVEGTSTGKCSDGSDDESHGERERSVGRTEPFATPPRQQQQQSFSGVPSLSIPSAGIHQSQCESEVTYTLAQRLIGVEAEAKPVNSFFVTPMSPVDGEALWESCYHSWEEMVREGQQEQEEDTSACRDPLSGRGMMSYREEGPSAGTSIPKLLLLEEFVRHWNVLQTGCCVNVKRANHWYAQEADFEDVAQEVSGLSFISLDSVKALIELGVRRWKDRLQRTMSLGWTTNQLRQFHKTAEGHRNFDATARCYGEEEFDAAFHVATDGHGSGTVGSELRRLLAHGQCDKKLFKAFCTKSPLAHGQTPFLVHFSNEMKDKGQAVYNMVFYVCFLVLFLFYLVSTRPLGGRGLLHLQYR